jgi:hypothetical protein
MNLTFTRLVLISAMALAIVSTASATPTCGATGLATTYVNADGTMNGYVCDIGNLQFSNFAYSYTPDPGGVSASNVSVLPQTTSGDQGLEFVGGWNVGGSQPNTAEDSDISFTVTALTGTISALTIDLGSPTFTGGGSVDYTETFCSINSTCSTFVEDSSTSTTAFTTTVLLSSTAIGGPVTSLNIVKDLDLNANGGTAKVSNFANVYTNGGVPEPRGISLLLGLGLMGGLVLYKRRQAVRS